MALGFLPPLSNPFPPPAKPGPALEELMKLLPSLEDPAPVNPGELKLRPNPPAETPKPGPVDKVQISSETPGSLSAGSGYLAELRSTFA